MTYHTPNSTYNIIHITYHTEDNTLHTRQCTLHITHHRSHTRQYTQCSIDHTIHTTLHIRQHTLDSIHPSGLHTNSYSGRWRCSKQMNSSQQMSQCSVERTIIIIKEGCILAVLNVTCHSSTDRIKPCLRRHADKDAVCARTVLVIGHITLIVLS